MGSQQQTRNGQEAGAQAGGGDIEVLHPEAAAEQVGALIGSFRATAGSAARAPAAVFETRTSSVFAPTRRRAGDVEAVRRPPHDARGRPVDDDLRDLPDRWHDGRPEGAPAQAGLLGVTRGGRDGSTEVELGHRGRSSIENDVA